MYKINVNVCVCVQKNTEISFKLWYGNLVLSTVIFPYRFPGDFHRHIIFMKN